MKATVAQVKSQLALYSSSIDGKDLHLLTLLDSIKCPVCSICDFGENHKTNSLKMNANDKFIVILML